MVFSRMLVLMLHGFKTALLFMAMNVLYFIKIGFLWFFVMFAITYWYFLKIYKAYVTRIRKQLALLLAQSLGYGILLTVTLFGLYEVIVNAMCESDFFKYSINSVCALSIIFGDSVNGYKIMGISVLMLSTFFSCNYLGKLLDESHDNYVSHWYGLIISCISLLCGIFLWFII